LRLLRRIAKLLVVVAIATIILATAMVGYFRYKAHVARSVLSDARRLPIGVPVVDVLPLVTRYNGKAFEPETLARPCVSQVCDYAIQVQTFLLPHWHSGRLNRLSNWLNELLGGGAFDRLGVRLWQASVEIDATNDHRVRSVQAEIYVEGPCHKSLMAGWELANDAVEQADGREGRVSNGDSLRFLWTNLNALNVGEGMTAYVTPSANAAEREGAFGLNTDCLDRLGEGCFFLSDIFPSAVKWQRSHGSPLGASSQTCHGLRDPDWTYPVP